MITYYLYQRPVSGHNYCEGIMMEIAPLSPTTGCIVTMRCCPCCRDEAMEPGTVVSLPRGNWKQAEILSYGEDATAVKPRELKVENEYERQPDQGRGTGSV